MNRSLIFVSCVNAHPLGTAQDVATAVKAWLSKAHFGVASDDVFVKKWTLLSEDARKVVAGLLDEGGRNVKETATRHAASDLVVCTKHLLRLEPGTAMCPCPRRGER